jgi:DNA-binding NtrC family response regulator
MRGAEITSKSEPMARKRARAIVACVDPEIRHLLIDVLSELGLQPVLSETVDDVKVVLAEEETAMAFVQPSFGGVTFREVLEAAERPASGVSVIVCSEFYDKDLYIEAMALGAFDYLAFPYRHEEVAWVINHAVDWISPLKAHVQGAA